MISNYYQSSGSDLSNDGTPSRGNVPSQGHNSEHLIGCDHPDNFNHSNRNPTSNTSNTCNTFHSNNEIEPSSESCAPTTHSNDKMLTDQSSPRSVALTMSMSPKMASDGFDSSGNNHNSNLYSNDENTLERGDNPYPQEDIQHSPYSTHSTISNTHSNHSNQSNHSNHSTHSNHSNHSNTHSPSPNPPNPPNLHSIEEESPIEVAMLLTNMADIASKEIKADPPVANELADEIVHDLAASFPSFPAAYPSFPSNPGSFPSVSSNPSFPSNPTSQSNPSVPTSFPRFPDLSHALPVEEEETSEQVGQVGQVGGSNLVYVNYYGGNQDQDDRMDYESEEMEDAPAAGEVEAAAAMEEEGAPVAPGAHGAQGAPRLMHFNHQKTRSVSMDSPELRGSSAPAHDVPKLLQWRTRSDSDSVHSGHSGFSNSNHSDSNGNNGIGGVVPASNHGIFWTPPPSPKVGSKMNAFVPHSDHQRVKYSVLGGGNGNGGTAGTAFVVKSIAESVKTGRPRSISLAEGTAGTPGTTGTAASHSAHSHGRTHGRIRSSSDAHHKSPVPPVFDSSTSSSSVSTRGDHKKAIVPTAPRKLILRKKFSWKNYPELEEFLIANREEYLRHSTLNYTMQQKKYNNCLTERMIQLAAEKGYEFDEHDFSFVTVRDRIRCYFKSYVQSMKKRGVVIGYAARKAGLVTEEELEVSAHTSGKIYVPRR